MVDTGCIAMLRCAIKNLLAKNSGNLDHVPNSFFIPLSGHHMRGKKNWSNKMSQNPPMIFKAHFLCVGRLVERSI